MSYVDGYVLPLAKDKVEAYKKMAAASAQIWKEHGALEYRECVLEDFSKTDFCASFLDLTVAKENETVVFAFIVYPSREARDEINKKVFEDPRLQELCNPADSPFDPARMAFGGFTTLVQA